MLIIGEIIKTQGVRGEVKVKPITADIMRYKRLRTVYIGTVLYQIAALRIVGGFVYIRFVGIGDCDKAAELVGGLLQVDRINAIVPQDDEFFIADLIGCDLVVDGQLRGKIRQIYQHGAADVFEVLLTDGTVMLFPFLKKLQLLIDTEKRVVSAESKLLDEVAVINN